MWPLSLYPLFSPLHYKSLVSGKFIQMAAASFSAFLFFPSGTPLKNNTKAFPKSPKKQNKTQQLTNKERTAPIKWTRS